MKAGFIKNPRLLEETVEIPKDLLGFNKVKKEFKKFLKKIDRSAIVGLIGPFGMGKSTMLYQMAENDKKRNENIKWITFNAWKYPNKKDLWEGFIFDFIQSTNSKKWEKIRQKIDGEEVVDKQTLLSIGALFIDKHFLPGSRGLFEKFGVLFRSSPIKRTHEFQELLRNYINSKNGEFKDVETIYIVVEDIDRSQDGGIFFLETLNYFLKNYNFNKQIIVIAPLNKEYLKDKMELTEKYYLKALDYTFRFKTSSIDFSKFIKKIIDLKQVEGQENLAIDHLQYLLNFAGSENHGNMSIRKIKLLIREANKLYQSKLTNEEKKLVDIRIWLAFYFAKYIYNIQRKENILGSFTTKTGKQLKELHKRRVDWLCRLLFRISKETNPKLISLDYNPKLRMSFTPNIKYKLLSFKKDPFEGGGYELIDLYIQTLEIV